MGIDRTVQNIVGDQNYGFYFALFNFSIILNILLDIGITNYNNRNISRYNFLLNKHLSNIIGLKLVLAIVYAVFSLITAAIIGYSKVQFHLLFFLIFNQFLISFTLYLRSNITALQLFRTESFLSVLDRTLMIIICGFLLINRPLRERFTIQWFVYSQTAAYILTAIITFILVLKQSGKIRIRFNFKFFIVFLRKSYPYAILILLMALYNRIDSVMLERILPGTTGHEQAGIYAQAFRLLDAVSMFGALIAGLLLPIFSKMIKQRENMGGMVQLSFTLLIVPAVIVAVSSVFYDGEIMSLLYRSNIAHSSNILGILMTGFIGIASTYIFGTLLTANGSMRQLNLMALTGVVLNVGLNLILIPRFQAYGSAYASLATQLFTGTAQFIIAVKIFRLRPDMKYITKLAAFTAMAVILAVITKNMQNWVHGYFLMIAGSLIFAVVIKFFNVRDIIKIIFSNEQI